MVRKKQKAKLPVQQLAILAICRCAEPIAATSLHPYLPEMIHSFNVPIDKVARYSGRLSACFSLSACVTAIAWGRASDRFGRKPMILLALSGLMVGNLCFGFSTSLATAFASRILQGMSSGDVGIIRTAVAEMVPQKELQPRAFSVMPLVWVTGSIFGPIIGGNLAQPVKRYGGSLKKISTLEMYPFALPNLVTSVFFVIGILSGIFFLQETHQHKRHKKDYGLALGRIITDRFRQRPLRHYQMRRVTRDEDENAEGPLLKNDKESTEAGQIRSTQETKLMVPGHKVNWHEVFTKQSSISLIVYAGLAMHTIAFYQILPVFMNYPPNGPRDQSPTRNPLQFTGGFGLKSARIGLFYTIYGICGMFIQSLIFPPVAKKYGPLLCLKTCAIALPIIYLLMPFTSLIQSSHGQQAACLVLMLFKCAAGMFAFPCSTILMTNSASNMRILATLNGVATSVCALGQAAGPFLIGTAFTFGVNAGYIIIPFWTLTLVTIIFGIPVWWLVEMDGPTAGSGVNNDDHDDYEEDEEDEDHEA